MRELFGFVSPRMCKNKKGPPHQLQNPEAGGLKGSSHVAHTPTHMHLPPRKLPGLTQHFLGCGQFEENQPEKKDPWKFEPKNNQYTLFRQKKPLPGFATTPLRTGEKKTPMVHMNAKGRSMGAPGLVWRPCPTHGARGRGAHRRRRGTLGDRWILGGGGRIVQTNV